MFAIVWMEWLGVSFGEGMHSLTLGTMLIGILLPPLSAMDGGLGIRDARLTNNTLLGKLLWSMLHHKDKLWLQVLAHKYFGQNSI